MLLQSEINTAPIVFEAIMVVVILAFLYVAIQQKMNDVFKWLVFAGLAACVQNVGYLTILLSKEAAAAKTALAVEYCGIAYVTSFSMFFVLRFFEKRIPSWLKGAIIEEYMEQGFDDYLSKPVTGEALEEALYRHISRKLIIEE